ncbi:hypothetical protein K438DRAFT_1604668 [Mycena galopus ATCC 62051]|nr:hypothetical protein K438DRAFT_1604668 [Mycena galopus ATCC 62051]
MSSPPSESHFIRNAPITRSGVWYKDGSVVLQVENTQFRVHWGVLSQQSSFFRDMQELPQPPDQLSVEGCPVVNLHDSVVDAQHLLSALYNPALFNEKAIPFPYIASFVRLGQKYDFKGLFDIAVERLAFENPKTVEEYVALMNMPRTTPAVDHPTIRIVDYAGIRFDIVTLARENNLFAILPYAYYRLAKEPATLFEETQRPDGTVCVLSSVDRTTCTLGHEKLLLARWEPQNSLGWLIEEAAPVPGCTSVSACRKRRAFDLASVLRSPAVYAMAPSLVSHFQNMVCTACAELARTAMTAGRARMWEDLPSFFNLPPWSELKNPNEL